MNVTVSKFIALIITVGCLNGCWAAAVGVGGEAGYVASQEKRTVGETIDDQTISTTIKAKLLADSMTPGLKIDVDTLNKVVTLRGYVKSQKIADEAIKIAWETSGVKNVDSRLIVDAQS